MDVGREGKRIACWRKWCTRTVTNLSWNSWVSANRGNTSDTSGNVNKQSRKENPCKLGVDGECGWGRLENYRNTLSSYIQDRHRTHHRSVVDDPSGSPNHSFSSDCSRYSSAHRAGDTDNGSTKSNCGTHQDPSVRSEKVIQTH